MGIDLPRKKVRLDCNGEVLDALRQDTYYELLEIQIDLRKSRSYQLIDAASGLLVADATTLTGAKSHEAFTAGAAIAFNAFDKSDASDNEMNQVYKYIRIRSMPYGVYTGNSAEMFRSFVEISDEGLTSHPEIKDINYLVKEFYEASTLNPLIGRVASIGVGFGLYQIDKALETSRRDAIYEIYNIDTIAFDPNAKYEN